MSEWPIVPLGELAENISRPFKFEDHESVVFINTGDVLSGKLLHADRSSRSGLPGQAKKAIQIDDILLSEIRPANQRFPQQYLEGVFGSSVTRQSTAELYHHLSSDEPAFQA